MEILIDNGGNGVKKKNRNWYIGDGLICVDEEIFEYESDNKPDYIGYHLSMDKHLWFQTKTSKNRHWTISTDGILLSKCDGKSYPKGKKN